ncbi:MAG: ATP-binding cassette domain-containing protein [Nitrospinota bacterium]|nr:ATP-binding cassette domain-containing protein [Nitrospinota bacterium]
MISIIDAAGVTYKFPTGEFKSAKDGSADPAGRPLLHNIHFTLNSGEIIFIKGESGCGKSTFLKLLNRLIDPDTGRMEFNGKEYHSIDVMELRRKIQLVPQTTFLMPEMTVRENLLFAAPDAGEEKIVHLMDAFNLPHNLLENSGSRISVGQSQRFSVIRALLMKPDVILLDEPTAALDPDNRERFQESFLRLHGEGGLSAVWVTHDELKIANGKGRQMRLDKGGFI